MDKSQKEKLREFLHITNALYDSMKTTLNVAPNELWNCAGYWQYIRKYNQIIDLISKAMPIDTALDRYDLDKIPGPHDTTVIDQKEYFDSVHSNVAILKAYLENKLDFKADEITNLTNFFQANLRKAVFHIPDKEVEIQDAVEQLLIGRGLTKGLDYDRESGRVKISIKEVVPDFIFPKLGLALEVKLSKDKDKSRVIVDEINADIRAYGKKYPYLLFVVYDLGTIRDEVEFKQDLEVADSVTLIVVKQ